ncbi:MAG: hypothetical protein EDM82_08425 [Cyanobacteria bacterium CYA]|nr:MAG: hypothetical protein EDM82_08425 [Cyanobacteria bacterium CYA]
MLERFKRKQPVHRSHGEWDMAAPVLRLPGGERIDLLRSMSGIFITGMTGSSKSTSSAKHAARSLVRLGCGGLVLTVKNELPMWQRLCTEEGRGGDLVAFGPQNHWRFDPVAFEVEREGPGAGQVENVVHLLARLVDFSSRDRSQGGRDNEPYWRNACLRLLRSGVGLLILATGRVSVLDLYRLVISAPQSLDDVRSEQWRSTSRCFRLLTEAEQRPRTPSQSADLEIIADYWLVEFPALSEKTRSVIVSLFTATCDCLLRGTLRDLFCAGSNVTPVDAERGRIILVDLSLKEFGVTGLYANLLWKTAFQRSIERRDIRESPRPVFCWADEGHYLLHSEDSLFQSTCRGARCASILITQNIANLDAALGTGDAGRAEAESLLSNFGTLVFHCNTCQRTNTLAADLIGRERALMASGNVNRSADDEWSAVMGLDLLGQGGGTSMGFSEQYQYTVEPSAFCRLRSGGPAHGWEADAIVVKSGELFRSTGTTWLRVTFRQDL